MKSSQVSHQDIIDKYPYVIIAAEFIGYFVILVFVCISSIPLDKTSCHGQSKIVIDRYSGILLSCVLPGVILLH